MQKPDHIRVRAREELPPPPAGVRVLPRPQTPNLPQGGWVGGWVGKSHVHRTRGEILDTTVPDKPVWKDRLKLVLEWMVTNEITNRAALFAGCAAAGNSAALHNAAIKKLKRAKLIERQWREYIFTVDRPLTQARTLGLIE